MTYCAARHWSAVFRRRGRVVYRSGNADCWQAYRRAEVGCGAGAGCRRLDAFQRFVNKLPEGCELRVSNLEFQPLRTLARAGVKPIPGRLSLPDRSAALADIYYPAAGPGACRIITPIAC